MLKQEKEFHGIALDLIKLNVDYAGIHEQILQRYLRSYGDEREDILAGRIQTQVTDGNGEAKFSNVEAGTYLIRETNNEDKTGIYQYSEKGETECYSMNIGKIIKINTSDYNTDIRVNFSNDGYGGLEINKVSNKGTQMKNVKFGLYKVDYNHKLTIVKSFDYNGQSLALTSEWSEYNEDLGLREKYCIKNGTYYLFEESNKNEGYNLELQGNKRLDSYIGNGEGQLSEEYRGKHYIEGIGAFIRKVEIKTGEICKLTDENKIENEPVVSIYIKKQIEELGETSNNIRLRNATEKEVGFQIFENGNKNAVSLWDISEFFTNSSGVAEIRGLHVGKTYALYETTFPDEVDPAIQPGYEIDSDGEERVKIATMTVDEDGEISNVTLIEDTYQGNRKIEEITKKTKDNEGNGVEAKVTFNIVNRKYIKISGRAWEDVTPNTKELGNTDNLYNAHRTVDNDLIGINVYLYDSENNNCLESTITNNKGEYKFNKKLQAKLVSSGKYYVVFDYSGYYKVANSIEEYSDSSRFLYSPVLPRLTDKNGSKVVGREMTGIDENLIKDNKYYLAYTGYRKRTIWSNK